MYSTALASSLTVVDTEQRYPLGMTYAEPATEFSDANEGPQVWIYVKNVAAGTLAAGRSVKRDLATTDNYEVIESIATTPPGAVVGTVPGDLDSAFVDDSFAWIKRFGSVEVDVDATVVAGEALVPAATGELSPAAAVTDASSAYALAARTGAGLVKAHIDCRG
jgi:hypothetical protein